MLNPQFAPDRASPYSRAGWRRLSITIAALRAELRAVLRGRRCGRQAASPRIINRTNNAPCGKGVACSAPTEHRGRITLRPYRPPTIRLLRFPKAVSCRGVACYAPHFAATPRLPDLPLPACRPHGPSALRTPRPRPRRTFRNSKSHFKRKGKRTEDRNKGSRLKSGIFWVGNLT